MNYDEYYNEGWDDARIVYKNKKGQRVSILAKSALRRPNHPQYQKAKQMRSRYLDQNKKSRSERTATRREMRSMRKQLDKYKEKYPIKRGRPKKDRGGLTGPSAKEMKAKGISPHVNMKGR